MGSKKLIGLVVFLLIIVNHITYGSPTNRESVDSLYHKARSLSDENPDSALKYAELQREMAIDIDYKLGLIKAYYAIGYINYRQKFYDIAALNYFNGLKLASKETSRDYKTRKMLLLQNLAQVYDETYQRDDAIMYTKEAIALAKELDRHNNLGQLYFNLGYFYYMKEDYDHALNWFATAESHLSKFPDEYQLAKTYNYVGNIYNRTARYVEAREQYNKALKISETVESLKENRVYYVSNLGENALKSGDHEKAKEYYNEALDLALQFDDPVKIKAVTNNLGDIYLKEEKYDQAIVYYNRTLAYCKNQDVIDKEYRRANKNMSEAYEKLRDYKNALAHRDMFIAQVDLLQSTKDQLAEQNAQYRMREVEWIIERQNRQARLMAMQTQNFWFKFSVSLLTIVLAYAAYKAIRYYRGIRAVKKWLATD